MLGKEERVKRGALFVLIAATSLGGCAQGSDPAESLANPVEAPSGGTTVKVKDPVCGMVIDPSSARWSQRHQGKSFSFCSSGCRDKFRAEPSSFSRPLAE